MNVLRPVALGAMLCCATLPATAQTVDPKAAVHELASLNAVMLEIDTLRRLSEDIVFWQSVAIMGAEHGWEFQYNSQDTDTYEWTYRLYSTLDEAPLEAIRAKQAISRNRNLTDDDKKALDALFAKYEEMQAVGGEVYRLLQEEDIDAAARVFEAQTLELRREISRMAASSKIVLRDRSRQVSMDVRLGK